MVLSGVAYKALRVGEGHVRRCRTIALIVGNDFDFAIGCKIIALLDGLNEYVPVVPFFS